MRVVCSNDWHGSIPKEFPEGDVLVIAGDVCPFQNHDLNYQAKWIKTIFRDTLDNLPFQEIIFVAGNHDFIMQHYKLGFKWFSDRIHYLEDESITIGGVNFHGAPWSTQFGNWAFMEDEFELWERWNVIPDETDVLVVHGPPYFSCDRTIYGQKNAGSRSLREKIVDISPTLVVTGHIHEAYGMDLIGRTKVANVSHMAYLPDQNTFYNPINPPMVFDIVK